MGTETELIIRFSLVSSQQLLAPRGIAISQMQPNIPRTVSTTNQRVYGVGGRGDEAANDDVVKDVAAAWRRKKWQPHSIQ